MGYMMDDVMRETQREAVLLLACALDPHEQGNQWPDPIAWDGRPLPTVAADLLAQASAMLEQTPEAFTHASGGACLRDVHAAAYALRYVFGWKVSP